jgi:hypothetical protein
MSRLIDGEREIMAEQERDTREGEEAEWADSRSWAYHCPTCGAPDDVPGGCRCWLARVEGIAGPPDDDDLPF